MPTRSDSAPERPALFVYCSTYDRRVGGEERRSYRAGGGGTDIGGSRARGDGPSGGQQFRFHTAVAFVAACERARFCSRQGINCGFRIGDVTKNAAHVGVSTNASALSASPIDAIGETARVTDFNKAVWKVQL